MSATAGVMNIPRVVTAAMNHQHVIRKPDPTTSQQRSHRLKKRFVYISHHKKITVTPLLKLTWHIQLYVVSEMTYTVSSGTLNSTIPYLSGYM